MDIQRLNGLHDEAEHKYRNFKLVNNLIDTGKRVVKSGNYPEFPDSSILLKKDEFDG